MAEAEGDLEKARGYLAKAIELEPGSAYLKAKMAYMLKEAKRLEEALKYALSCIELQPSEPECRTLAGDLYGLMGREDEAIQNYEQAVRLSSDNHRVRLLLTTLLIRKARFSEALGHLDAIIHENPELIIAHYYRGRVNLELRRMREAEASFLDALRFNERLEPALFDLGTLYQMTGRNVDAIETYEKLLSFHPQNLSVRERLVSLYTKAGLKDKAEREINAIKGLSQPGGPDRQALGLVFLRQGRLDESIEELGMIVSAWPKDHKTRYYLAIAHEEKGEKGKAIEHFSLIPPDSEFYPNARIHMAYLLESEKRLDEAIAAMQEALEKVKNKIEFYLVLGSLYEDKKDYRRAKEVLQEGLAKEPKNVELLFRYAVVLDKDNDKEGCIKHMREIIEIDPNHAEALNYIGYTYAEQGVRLDEALSLIEKALKIKPDSGYIIDSLGWIYYQKGQYAEAVKHLEKAAEMLPTDPTINEHLGDAYLKLRRYAEALEKYKKALSLEPTDAQRLKEKISETERGLGK
jgi:tetratricopeptide (TPR) repeat protein